MSRVGQVVKIGDSVGVVVAEHGPHATRDSGGAVQRQFNECITVHFPEEKRTEQHEWAELELCPGEWSEKIRETVADLKIDSLSGKQRREEIEKRETRLERARDVAAGRVREK